MSTPQLRISDDLSLPLDAVTETFGILAIRGVGKTHTASVLAEEMIGAGLQVVVIDPTDVWWGLRASADGEREGLPILVLGGQHADLPIEASSGKVLADLVVEDGLSVVLSTRHLSMTDQRRLVTEFAEELYQRKGEDRYRTPLHLMLDEADAWVPQRYGAGEARMVGAIDRIVRRGRASGIGVTLISQRSAKINKDVLSQVEVLIALRSTSPQDRKALEAWIDAHDVEGQRAAFMASLASLGKGDAWVWSPGWLHIFKRVHIRARETFDSSATPKVGERPLAPKRLAPVDIEAIRAQLAETLEKAIQEDPRELHREIDRLRKELKESASRQPTVRTEVERVEVPVIPPGISGMATDLENIAEDVRQLLERVQELARSFQLALLLESQPRSLSLPASSPEPKAGKTPRSSAPQAAQSSEQSLRAGERAMLAVLARYYPRPVTRAQLGTLSRFTPSGGTFRTYMGTLKRNGMAREVDGEVIITEAGLREVTNDSQREPMNTEQLLSMWRSKLRAGERRLLDLLVEVYPRSMRRAVLADLAEFEPSGGTFRTYLGTLKRNGLIETEGDTVKASSTLFLHTVNTEAT